MHTLFARDDVRTPRHAEPEEVALLSRLIADGEDPNLPLAASVLASCGGVAGLASATISQLVSAGLATSAAERLRASILLGRRVQASPQSTRLVDRSGAVALVRPILEPLAHEEMHALFLAPDGTFLGRQMIARGGVDAVCLHVRDVLAPALEARASRLVLAHNHPSGRSTPSTEDRTLSERVLEAADLVGIRLVDHLVIARDGVASAMAYGDFWPSSPSPRRR